MKKYVILSLILLGLLYPVPLFSVELSEENALQEEKHWTEKAELLLFFEESVITATKTKKKASDVPATVTVITAEQIRNMGARNIMDVLKVVPGVNIARMSYGTWKGVEVRGIRTTFSEKVLLLLDGHNLNSVYTGGFIRYFEDLVINNIKQIEIIRGPLSAMYGNSAFVAVINIITKKAEDINGVEVKGGWGSFDTQQHTVLLGHEIDKFGVTGYFDFFDTNGPKLNVEKDFLSPAPFSDAPGHIDEWTEKKDLNLSLSYGDFTPVGQIPGKGTWALYWSWG